MCIKFEKDKIFNFPFGLSKKYKKMMEKFNCLLFFIIK